MPDGFEPHRELARIYTLRQIITDCSELSRDAVQVLKGIMLDPTEPSAERIKASGMIIDRAFGRPKQQVDFTINTEKENKISIELPSNNREEIPESPIIDAIAV